jgi:hypothetical protein
LISGLWRRGLAGDLLAWPQASKPSPAEMDFILSPFKAWRVESNQLYKPDPN